MNSLNRAIDICGGVTALAEKCGVHQTAVSKWRTRKVSAKGAKKIEKATKGKVTRVQLRPDIFGN